MASPQPNLAPPARCADLIRAGLVVLGAFFVASFPARNPDIWQHLATGRAWVQGSYHFGSDPFAYTTQDAVWVNHGWLFDVTTYGIHESLGGVAVVVAKALLVALLAAWLLSVCWRGPHRSLAALCLAVALAAAAPYLLLRPIILSLLLLGITYCWLERNGRTPAWRASVPLLILFALWANLDEWFLLGPALVLLWWLGDLMMVRSRPAVDDIGQPRQLSLLLLAVLGLAVTLLNPHQVRVFTVPALLDPHAAEPWIDDIHDQLARQSPVEWLNWDASKAMPARWAYGLLALAGVFSFAVNGRALRASRMLIWATLFALSLYRSGAIPFFAVVAGAITALNLQDWLQRRSTASEPLIGSRLIRGVLGLASVVVFAAAALAAWLGWAQARPGQPARWDLVLDPSLEAAGRQLAAWRAEGRIAPQARALPTSAAAAGVLAWVAPEEKSFCDARPHTFPLEIRTDFAALRKLLFSAADAQEAAAWRALLRKHRITHLIVDDRDDEQLATGLNRLFGSRLWKLHHLRGRTTVFALREHGAVIGDAEVDVLALPWRPSESDRAPMTWPGRDPEPRDWHDAWKALPPDDPFNRDESLVWLAHFDSQRDNHAQRLRRLWSLAWATSLAATPSGSAGCLEALPGSVVGFPFLTATQSPRRPEPKDRLEPMEQFALETSARYAHVNDAGPPGSVFAAIRAARRALAHDPNDAVAHLRLGQAYLGLRRQTRERATLGTFVTLEHLRRVQAITALHHAVRLRPSLTQGHEALAAFYQERDQFDLALEQAQFVLRNLRRGETGAQAGVTTPIRIQYWEEMEKQLARAVRDAQLTERGQALDAFQRARLALSNGLPRQALGILMKADAASVGRDGFLLLIELLLEAGQTSTARELLAPDMEATLGLGIYRWLHAHLAAASGDYSQALEDFRSLDPAVDLPEFKLERADPHRAAALVLGRHLLNRAAALPHARHVTIQRIGTLGDQLRHAADVAALRGLLALEAGDIDLSRRELQRSLRLFDDPRGAGGLARHYLGLLAKE